MDISSTYISLFIMIGLAVIIPLVSSHFKTVRVPEVVLEILAGIIIGKSGFNIIYYGIELKFLSDFALAFLMFMSGLEVDFGLMRGGGDNKPTGILGKPAIMGGVIYILTVGLAFCVANLIKYFGLIQDEILLTLILSTTSLGIVVPTLRERNIIGTKYGQTILMSALIADFMTMVLITIFISFRSGGDDSKPLLIVLLFVAFFVIYRMLKHFMNIPFFDHLQIESSQIKVRGSLALIFIFIVFAEMLGTEMILGSFLAGVIVSLLNDKENSDLNIKLEAIGYGFLIPIFFIMVGVNLDLEAVIANPRALLMLPVLLLAVYVVKFVPSLLFRTQYDMPHTVACGILLSSHLSLIIATAAVALDMGLISQELNCAFILVAIITCAISPMAFNRILPISESKPIKKVAIIGWSDMVENLICRLDTECMKIDLVTDSTPVFKNFENLCSSCMCGSISEPEFLCDTVVPEADIVVVATGKKGVNENICNICKNVFHINHVVVMSGSKDCLDVDKTYGALVVSPWLSTIVLTENYIKHPNTFDLVFREDKFTIKETRLLNKNLYGKPLCNIFLPGDCLILSIMRNGNKIIPHGENELHRGDMITIVGSHSDVKSAIELLSR